MAKWKITSVESIEVDESQVPAYGGFGFDSGWTDVSDDTQRRIIVEDKCKRNLPPIIEQTCDDDEETVSESFVLATFTATPENTTWVLGEYATYQSGYESGMWRLMDTDRGILYREGTMTSAGLLGLPETFTISHIHTSNLELRICPSPHPNGNFSN